MARDRLLASCVVKTVTLAGAGCVMAIAFKSDEIQCLVTTG